MPLDRYERRLLPVCCPRSVADDHGEALVRRYYEEALNPRSFDRAGRPARRGFRGPQRAPRDSADREGLTRKYTMLRAEFPNFGFIEDLFSAEDRVAASVTVRGTHDGEFHGPTCHRQAIRVTSVGIFRIAEGRIAEHWVSSTSWPSNTSCQAP
jgi:predicted ester cyclase